jgi:cytochrome oxidase assembly protein ShyY1
LTNQYAIPNGYLRLVSEAQNNPKSLRAMPPPSIDEGNNLSYAMQWMLFAIMAILALFWRIRKDRELNNGGDSRPDRKSSSSLDEEIEDSVTRAK